VLSTAGTLETTGRNAKARTSTSSWHIVYTAIIICVKKAFHLTYICEGREVTTEVCQFFVTKTVFDITTYVYLCPLCRNVLIGGDHIGIIYSIHCNPFRLN